MCFVNVYRTGELGLLAHFLAEYDALFEQENVQLPVRHPTGVGTRMLGARQHPVQQQFTLGCDFALKKNGTVVMMVNSYYYY